MLTQLEAANKYIAKRKDEVAPKDSYHGLLDVEGDRRISQRDWLGIGI